jgi:hypothetical protein
MSGEGNPEHPYGIYSDHDYYNPVTDSWHRLENMAIAIHGVTGMAFIKGSSISPAAAPQWAAAAA